MMEGHRSAYGYGMPSDLYDHDRKRQFGLKTRFSAVLTRLWSYAMAGPTVISQGLDWMIVRLRT